MAEYRKLSELPEVIKINDRVIICGLYLHVSENGLFSMDRHGNDKIFKKLLIFNKEKFCEKFYGYKPIGFFSFPHCKDGDYKALTRVIRALMGRDEYPSIGLILYRWAKRKKKKPKKKD